MLSFKEGVVRLALAALGVALVTRCFYQLNVNPFVSSFRDRLNKLVAKLVCKSDGKSDGKSGGKSGDGACTTHVPHEVI